MKKSRFGKLALAAGLAIGTLAAVCFPIQARAADQMKGAEHLLQLKGITTKAQAESLKPGDSIAMVCAKCKSVTFQNVTTEKGHIKVVTVGEKHLCPGCDSTIEVVGAGKGKHDNVKHVCGACGDGVFCCATKAGSTPTAGMEKK